MAYRYIKLERYGFIIIFALLFFGLLNRILFPVVTLFLRLLVGFSPFQ